MDPITQGALGAALALSAAKGESKQTLKWVALCGLVGGLAPDLDVLITSKSDTLLGLKYHRHFTHSLFFTPFGAFLLSLGLVPLLKRFLTARKVFLFTFLGIITHAPLDTCTSYGTLLLWPLKSVRYALNIVSIVDPIYTTTLIGGVLGTLVLAKLKVVRAAFILSTIYILGFGSFQNYRAREFQNYVLLKRGHMPSKKRLTNVLATLRSFRSVYIQDDQIYVDQIQVPLFGLPSVISGGSTQLYDQGQFSKFGEGLLYKDLKFYSEFSDGYLSFIRNRDGRVYLGDLRYGVASSSVNPIWGVSFVPDQHSVHARKESFVSKNNNLIREFLDLLFGRE
ncbi:MAG: metal-dependent hydrolase [Bacteriovoracaceae bacterium]|jgi:inner membrane protein|nr:metal-dependent hydrolase [Bacteriovoracaceae bacterium]